MKTFMDYSKWTLDDALRGIEIAAILLAFETGDITREQAATAAGYHRDTFNIVRKDWLEFALSVVEARSAFPLAKEQPE